MFKDLILFVSMSLLCSGCLVNHMRFDESFSGANKRWTDNLTMEQTEDILQHFPEAYKAFLASEMTDDDQKYLSQFLLLVSGWLGQGTLELKDLHLIKSDDARHGLDSAEYYDLREGKLYVNPSYPSPKALIHGFGHFTSYREIFFKVPYASDNLENQINFAVSMKWTQYFDHLVTGEFEAERCISRVCRTAFEKTEGHPFMTWYLHPLENHYSVIRTLACVAIMDPMIKINDLHLQTAADLTSCKSYDEIKKVVMNAYGISDETLISHQNVALAATTIANISEALLASCDKELLVSALQLEAEDNNTQSQSKATLLDSFARQCSPTALKSAVDRVLTEQSMIYSIRKFVKEQEKFFGLKRRPATFLLMPDPSRE